MEPPKSGRKKKSMAKPIGSKPKRPMVNFSNPQPAPPTQIRQPPPPSQYPSHPPPAQWQMQPPPPQGQSVQSQWQIPPPPPPYTNLPSPSQACYTPAPPSPYAASPPINAKLYNLVQTSEFSPFENDRFEESVPETQFVQPQHIPLPDDDEDGEEDEVEEVDATGKKKVFAGRKPREHWSEEQEVALAKSWIQISECKQYGNDQKAEGFWKRVLGHYTALLGSTSRTFHSINTKWKTMNAAMGTFNGLYIQAERARSSGCNDLDVMKIAMSDYKLKTNKQFTHVAAWDVVKNHDKWASQDCFQGFSGMGPSGSSSSKRKSTEYDSGSNEQFIPDMNEDPSPAFKVPKSKKKQTASSSTSQNSVAEDITAYTQKKSEYFESKKEKNDLAKHLMQLQIESEKFKMQQREWKVFTEPHDHITDPVLLDYILKQKRALAEKHGWPVYF